MADDASVIDPAITVRRRGGLFWHADFRRLWIAQTVSETGTQVSLLALPLVMVQILHASAFEVGALTSCQTAAYLLIGLPAGAWCDRIRKRPILVAADLVRAMLLGSVPLAGVLHVLSVAQMYVVAGLAGTATVFFNVAYQSYLPELVTRDDLVEGNAKLSTTQSIARVAGPGISGLLVQAFTAPYAVLADAVSFLWSAGWVGAIRAREAAPAPRLQRHLGKEVGEGLRFVLAHPILRKIAGCTATANLWNGAMLAVDVVFLVRTVHLSAGAIGVLFSISSLGAVLGALGSRKFTRWSGQARAIWLSMLLFTPTDLLLPLTAPGWRVAFAAISLFIGSLGAVVYNVAQVSFRQVICPRSQLGRMNATMRFMVSGTLPLGALIGGALASWVGLRGALWITATGAQLAPVWVILSPLRRLRDIPSAADAATSQRT